jgi:hypothetical protein
MGKNHLMRRQGVWYYRRRVPRDLVTIVGKEVVQFSLGTTDRKEAEKRRSAEDLKWATQFEAARPSPTTAINCTGLPRADIIRLVQDYVERTDSRVRDRMLKDAPANEDERRAIIADTEYEHQILRDRDDPRRHQLIAIQASLAPLTGFCDRKRRRRNSFLENNTKPPCRHLGSIRSRYAR